MNKRMIALLSALGIMVTLAAPASAEIKGEEYKLRFKGSYSVTNNSAYPFNANGTTSFLNTADNSYSDILDEKVTIENDKFQYTDQSAEGNRKVAYTLEGIAPKTSKSLLYEAIVKTNSIDFELKPDNLSKGYPTSVSKFVNPSDKVESDDPLIIAKAQELKNSLPADQQENPYYVAKKTFEYVQLNMRYTFDNRARNKGAIFALKNLVGNCEDYSSLMTALLRANDIPARTITGYRINPSTVSTTEMNLLSSSNYTKHMWLEGYFEGYGWVAFDPTVSSSKTGSVTVKDTTTYSVTAYLPLTTAYMGTFAKLEQLYLKDSIEMGTVAHTMQTTGSPSAFNVNFLAKRTAFNTFEEEAIDAANKAPKPVSISITTRPSFSLTPVPLKANYVLSDRTQKEGTDITWVSSNPDVATVDENNNAVFTGKAGTVTFTAKGGILTSSFSTAVSRTLQVPEALRYSTEGQTLTATLVYNNGVKKTVPVTWSSSDPTIADIDANGKVTYTGKSGNFTITASTEDGVVMKKATTVSASLSVTGNMAYSPNPVQLNYDLIYNSGVKLKPDVTWKSSNTNVATASDTGVLTFTGKPGTTTLEVVAGAYKFTRNIVVSATLNVKGNMVYNPTPSQLTSELVYNSGVKANPSVTWTSFNTAVATVSDSGVLTFTGKPGTTTIQGVAGDYKFTRSIAVSATLNLKGNPVYSTAPVNLSTELVYNSGVRSNPEVTWSSSNTDVATISSNGVLTFTGKVGTTTITATTGDYKMTRSVTVSANLVIKGNLAYSPTPVSLATELVWNSGIKTNPDVTWKSSNTNVATVSEAGVVTFTGKPGTAVIEAVAGTFKATKSVSVSATLNVGGNLAYSPTPVNLTSQLVYNSGVKANPTVTWSSSNADVATISDSGVLTFTGKLGTTTIQGVAGDYKFTRNITVSATLAINGTLVYGTQPVQLTTAFSYSTGYKPNLPVTWSSSNPAVATVSDTGVVTFTGTPGTTVIEAANGIAKATKSVSVTGSLVIKENPIFSTTPVQLTTEFTYSNKTKVSPTVTWKSTNPDVATVSSTGVLTFTGKTGSTSIQATFGNAITSKTVTVSGTLGIKEGLAFSTTLVKLTPELAYSTGQRLTPQGVTWTSSNTNVATVSADGTVTFTGNVGSVTITATYGSLRAYKSVSVSGILAIKEALSFSTSPVRLTAEMTYNNGVKTTPQVTWTSSNPKVATVGTDGTVLFTGYTGSTTITATYGSVRVSKSVTVSGTLGVASPIQYSATPTLITPIMTYSNGVKTNPTGVVWTSSNNTIASFSPDGTITFTGKSGSITLTATFSGVTYRQYLTVPVIK